MSDKKLVVIGILTKGEVVDQVASLCVRIAMDQRYTSLILFQPTNYIDDGRNRLVKKSLEVGADYLMFLDSDNPTFLEKNPLDLIELDKDILGLPTPTWKVDPSDIVYGRTRGVRWNVFLEKGDEWITPFTGEGLTEVHAVGTGCMIIARRVLEAMKCPFMRTYDEDGIIERGSDLLFCKKARELGFTVWTHYDYPCSHFKYVDLAILVQLLDVRDLSQLNYLEKNINTIPYWDEQWDKREERILPFYNDIAEMCRDRIVLDYGCGRGDLLSLLDNTAEFAYGIDISETAVNKCADRRLKCHQADKVFPRKEVYRTIKRTGWDIITCTEVLEHLDDDVGKLKEFFEYADTVIYTVPNNCLPPAVEPEHRRVYTLNYIASVTPNLKAIYQYGDYLMAIASIRDEYPVPPKVVNVL